MITAWLYLGVFALTIWVAIDASKLGARRGRLGGGLLDMGPVGWFFSCFLFWLIAFPCYLVARPRLLRANQADAMRLHAEPFRYHPMYKPVGAGAQPQPAVPPGWYPDPHGQAPLRWWNGSTWSSDVS